MEENADKLKLQLLAGGNITKFAPLFSPDANFLFIVTDKRVQVFSASTGQFTHALEGAKHPLISLEYDFLDKDILVACTELGEVIHWKWSTGAVVNQVQLKIKADKYKTFNFLNLNHEQSLCAVVTIVKRGTPVQCFIVNTVTGRPVLCPLDLKLKRQQPIVAVDKENFKYFVIAQGMHLFFVNYESWEWKKLTNTMQVPITCVKIHPKEELVATGDETGKVMLWRNFFKASQDVRMTLFHWHHTRVTSVAFSNTGSAIYSSGLEAVLVRWNIHRPDLRQFVPRMASIILHIASSNDNSNIAVCTADNGIQILQEDFKTKCTLQDFTYTFDDKTGKEAFPVGLKVNPRKNTLVFNGRAGHLQFYSAYTKTMLYNVDIVVRNQLSFESEKIIYNTRVTQVAFNIDWMATGEVFNDEQHLPEVRLKFWEYDQKAQSYSLNTNIELPHEGGFRAIEFSNPYHVDNLLCATVGCDNIIKAWSLEDSNNIHKKSKTWFCVGQTDYKKFPIQSIGFSQDGSLLTAGFGNTLCVYKSENLKLMTALVPGGSFDGCLHKAQIRIPKLKQNGSKIDLNAKRQNIVKLFSNLLHKKDETLLEVMKNSVKTTRTKEMRTIDNSQKQLLYKKIRSMNQLNLFQKLLLYQKLGISFQLSEEWHAKMVAYVRANLPSTTMSTVLNKQVHCLNVKSRFKAKYMIDKYVKRKLGYDQKIAHNLPPLLSLLKKNGHTKPVAMTNGIQELPEESDKTSNIIVPPMQSVLLIKKIFCCYGDFAHLVVACTENRILIWNLLTLRLENVLKLTMEQIAIDPQTNLVSVFTKNQELYIFGPSDALTLYFRPNMPRVLGAVWLPRRHPKSQAILVNWQSRSILYFLTDNNEILYLGEKDDIEENSLTFANESSGSSVKYSTFGAFTTNQVKNTQNSKVSRQPVSIGVHGKAAIKSFLDMSSHTMAPLSLLCNDFLKSVIELNLPDEDKKSKVSKIVTENGQDDSSSDEDNNSAQRTQNKKPSINTKANENEKLPSENYLQKIANEMIEIEF